MSKGDGTNELIDFRQTLYACFTRWGDALFELANAALCATGPISSVPALSLEGELTRSHGSLYNALATGTDHSGPAAPAGGDGRPHRLGSSQRYPDDAPLPDPGR